MYMITGAGNSSILTKKTSVIRYTPNFCQNDQPVWKYRPKSSSDNVPVFCQIVLTSMRSERWNKWIDMALVFFSAILTGPCFAQSLSHDSMNRMRVVSGSEWSMWLSSDFSHSCRNEAYGSLSGDGAVSSSEAAWTDFPFIKPKQLKRKQSLKKFVRFMNRFSRARSARNASVNQFPEERQWTLFSNKSMRRQIMRIYRIVQTKSSKKSKYKRVPDGYGTI